MTTDDPLPQEGTDLETYTQTELSDRQAEKLLDRLVTARESILDALGHLEADLKRDPGVVTSAGTAGFDDALEDLRSVARPMREVAEVELEAHDAA